MSRGRGFVPWWRLRRLPGLVVLALRRDRLFRWASAGALICLVLLLGRFFDPAGVATVRQPGQDEDVAPSRVAGPDIPPPPAYGSLPSPSAPAAADLTAPVRSSAPSASGPIAPSVPLGPAPAPRDTFGTAPVPKTPAP